MEKNKKNDIKNIHSKLNKNIIVGGPLIAFFILAISLTVTYFAWFYNSQVTNTQAQLKFEVANKTILTYFKENPEVFNKNNQTGSFSFTDQYLYQNVDFKIYTGESINSDNLFYDSNPLITTARNNVSSFNMTDHLSINGNIFTIYSFVSNQNFDNYTANWVPKLIAILGFIGSISIFGITLSILSARRRAVDIARLITKNLETKSLELEEINSRLSKETNENNAILSSMVECLIGVSNDGKILFMNQIAMAMTGYAGVDAYGKSISEVLPLLKNEELIKEENSPIYKAIKNRDMGRVYLYDNVYTKDKSGRIFPIILSAVPLSQDLSEGGISIIVMFHDISTEKAVDHAKTEFVSLAAHQLRMPLTTIRWYVEMLLDGDQGPILEGQKEYISEIEESNKRMIFLVNNLLNVSRVRLGTFTIEPVPSDLTKIVESVIAEFRPIITKKKMNIETEFSEQTKIFNADSNLMRVIFQNLISNALKYTGEEGKIKVSIGENNNRFFLSVIDNGYGIPKEDQSKIFTQLYRADNVREKEADGSGLGLYMIKTIIEEAGGTISFNSEENKGTQFFVTFPKTGMRAKKGSVTLT